MASYCDEFSFDEVFEDPSYIQVSINQTRQVKSYTLLQDEEEENDENEDPDYEEIKEFEMGLHELQFMKDSMTEEELDRFWKEMSAKKYENNRSKVYPIYDLDVDVEENECEFYFQREIMTI